MVDVKTRQAARCVFKVSRGGCVRVKEHSRNRMGGMVGATRSRVRRAAANLHVRAQVKSGEGPTLGKSERAFADAAIPVSRCCAHRRGSRGRAELEEVRVDGLAQAAAAGSRPGSHGPRPGVTKGLLTG